MQPVAAPTRTTCPRDCYDACGVLVLQRDGRLVVRGDPEHPVSRGALCRKCTLAYNGVLQDRSERLTTPLRRLGTKGEGRFEPISWDEALAEIAVRLRAVIDEHGATTIVNAHYTGTCALLGYSFPLRLIRRLGATEVEADTVCNLAGHAALGYVYGTLGRRVRSALGAGRCFLRRRLGAPTRRRPRRTPTTTGCPRRRNGDCRRPGRDAHGEAGRPPSPALPWVGRRNSRSRCCT
ncbi:MAG: molybdopterin-dependent oxidoreductase [Gaiellales bacterium]